MSRKIIKIDESKCNGCGLCVDACHEGAIGLVDGKAKLLREDYCDGLGDCLPVCPAGAISFEVREDLEHNESETNKNSFIPTAYVCGCPGTQAKEIKRTFDKHIIDETDSASYLNQWPVQIKLAPANAPYFNNAHLLIAADCTAYAYGNFHSRFMKNRITLIGCPKLDEGDYAKKLTEILTKNNIKSVTVIRMEVPCCGGIENAVITALKNCGKMISWQSITISTDGKVLEG